MTDCHIHCSVVHCELCKGIVTGQLTVYQYVKVLREVL